MIKILTSGAMNLVQDQGRFGHLHEGVCTSGAMDSVSLAYANTLVGNSPSAAGIEITLFPFKVSFERDTVFACTGADGEITLDGQLQPPWWRCKASAGQTLLIERPGRGVRMYLGLQGGIDLPPVLGARATDMKAALGGYQGRGLRRFDTLPLGQVIPDLPIEACLGSNGGEMPALLAQIDSGCIGLRVLPAAEFDEFDERSQSAWLEQPWLVTAESNRQGYRLQGAQNLQLAVPRELLSHGIVPGTIQVPPSGQPIIQLAEANTCGGYPKIGTVIEADLWRLGQVPPGTALRFERVSLQQAIEALSVQVQQLKDLRDSLPLVAGRVH